MAEMDRLCPADADLLYCFHRGADSPDPPVRLERSAGIGFRLEKPTSTWQLTSEDSPRSFEWRFEMPKGEVPGLGIYRDPEQSRGPFSTWAESELRAEGTRCGHAGTFELVELRVDEENRLSAFAAEVHQVCRGPRADLFARICHGCRPELFDRSRSTPLELEVTDLDGAVPLNGERLHRIEVRNRGDREIRGARIVVIADRDAVPSGPTQEGNTCEVETTYRDPGQSLVTMRKITCDLGTISPGGAAELDLGLRYGAPGIAESRVLLFADEPSALPRSNRLSIRTAVLEHATAPALFAAGPADGPSRLYRLDPTDGAATELGATGFEGCTALAFASADELFAACHRPVDATSVLVRLDPESGAGFELGALGIEGAGELAISDQAWHLPGPAGEPPPWEKEALAQAGWAESDPGSAAEPGLVAISAPQNLIWRLDPRRGEAHLVGTYRGNNRIHHGLASTAGRLYLLGEIELEGVVEQGWAKTVHVRDYPGGALALAPAPRGARTSGGSFFALV
ncbi:MAG: hypothetical protein MI919_07670, partial [Holophagales bacterium]|nr:hypothetical protein [Holophagales bacterium]